jgi:hypothetical protein
LQRGSALLGVGHASQHMHWLRRSLVTGPLHLAIKDHPPVKLFPFRALRSLSSSRLLRLPACRLALRLPMGFWSLQRHPSEEPLVETRRPVRAPVPLSGFRNPSAVSSNSEFRGLVSCRNRSWDPPFRAFPSQRSPTPLEAACSPAVIHPRAVVHRLTPYHRRFRRTPALSRDRPLPPTTMDSLFN